MGTPPPPASQEREPRMFQMDKHMRAMREAAATHWHSAEAQVPAPALSHTQDTVATSSSVARSSDTCTGADSKRKRQRSGKRTEAKAKVAVPVVVVPTLPQFESRSAELLPRQATTNERDELARQVRELEARLELLRVEAGLPSKAALQTLTKARELNAATEEMVHTNQQFMGQLHTMASQYQHLPPVNPLATYIHLPRDKLQRCALLQAMKGVKLRRAAEDGIARFRDLEDSLSYLSEEKFMTEDGTYHCNRFEVAAFPQFKTARQLYDALIFWWHNLEISVTEMIDHVSLREDKDDMGPTIWNQRLTTVVSDVGCTEEVNNVGFAQFYESYDLMDGAPLGVILQDSVDVDDLHPYKPLERTRKDVQVYYLFSEYVDPVTQHKSVLLKTAMFNAQLAPQFPIEPRVVAKLYENMSRWSSYIIEYLSNFIVEP